MHWHGLRLDNRYDGTHDTKRRSRSASRSPIEVHVPRSGRLLVPPAHPRGLRPGDGPLRQHPRRPGRSGLLAAREPRAHPDARRPPHRGRGDRRLQPHGDRPCRDGPLRQRHARRRRVGPAFEREAGRDRPLLLHEHGQRPRVQGRIRRRKHEARRRRQRPGTSTRSSPRTSCSPRRSASSSTSSSIPPERAALEHRTPGTTYRLAAVAVCRTSSRIARRAFTCCARTPTSAAERERNRPVLLRTPAGPTRPSLQSWPRWTWAMDAKARHVYACPMSPRRCRDVRGSCPKCGVSCLPARRRCGRVRRSRLPDARWRGSRPANARCGQLPTRATVQRVTASMRMAMSTSIPHGGGDGIEWEDGDEPLNRGPTPATPRAGSLSTRTPATAATRSIGALPSTTW